VKSFVKEGDGLKEARLMARVACHRRSAALSLFAFLVLGLALAPRAHGFLYWATPGSIGRANLDTAGITSSFITGTAGACGVASDGTQIYWANESPASIGRANVDGTGVEQSFVANAGSYPCGVAVNGTHIYWTNDAPGGAIGRANLDGSDANPSFITGAGSQLSELAIDATHIYWSHGSGIARANLDGSDPNLSFITSASYPPAPSSSPPYGLPNGVAVDASHLYWSHTTGIGRANLDGTGADAGFIETSAAGVTVGGNYLYWVVVTHPAKGFTNWRLGRARTDGTCVDHSFLPFASALPIRGLATDAGGPPTPEPPPPNDFSFGKVKRNTERGTAKLIVELPGPGRLALAETKKLEGRGKVSEAGGKESLRLKPTKPLPVPGERTVKAKVTFVPAAGCPNTEAERIELARR
jgi:hypothetical protein